MLLFALFCIRSDSSCTFCSLYCLAVSFSNNFPCCLEMLVGWSVVLLLLLLFTCSTTAVFFDSIVLYSPTKVGICASICILLVVYIHGDLILLLVVDLHICANGAVFAQDAMAPRSYSGGPSTQYMRVDAPNCNTSPGYSTTPRMHHPAALRWVSVLSCVCLSVPHARRRESLFIDKCPMRTCQILQPGYPRVIKGNTSMKTRTGFVCQ